MDVLQSPLHLQPTQWSSLPLSRFPKARHTSQMLPGLDKTSLDHERGHTQQRLLVLGGGSKSKLGCNDAIKLSMIHALCGSHSGVRAPAYWTHGQKLALESHAGYREALWKRTLFPKEYAEEKLLIKFEPEKYILIHAIITPQLSPSYHWLVIALWGNRRNWNRGILIYLGFRKNGRIRFKGRKGHGRRGSLVVSRVPAIEYITLKVACAGSGMI